MEQGRPLLTDFGLARRPAVDGDVTTGGIQGTIEYMAPESFRSVRSPQVDVWAAAVICYEMLAGRRPYPRDPHAICTQPLPPLPTSVPVALRQVLEQALKQDEARRRYKEALELRTALLEALASGTEETTLVRVLDVPTMPGVPVVAGQIVPQQNEPLPTPPVAPRSVINLRGGNFKTKNLIMGPAAERGAAAGSSIIDVEFESVEVSEDTNINH
jgi:serine/threonine protein kinase